MDPAVWSDIRLIAAITIRHQSALRGAGSGYENLCPQNLHTFVAALMVSAHSRQIFVASAIRTPIPLPRPIPPQCPAACHHSAIYLAAPCLCNVRGGAGMAGAAVPSNSLAAMTDRRMRGPSSASDRAVTIPDVCGRAGEGFSDGDNGNGKKKGDQCRHNAS
jgi:hypothetical protein